MLKVLRAQGGVDERPRMHCTISTGKRPPPFASIVLIPPDETVLRRLYAEKHRTATSAARLRTGRTTPQRDAESRRDPAATVFDVKADEIPAAGMGRSWYTSGLYPLIISLVRSQGRRAVVVVFALFRSSEGGFSTGKVKTRSRDTCCSPGQKR